MMRTFINIMSENAKPHDFMEASKRLFDDLPNSGAESVRTYVMLDHGLDPYDDKPPENLDELTAEWCENRVQEIYWEIFDHRIKNGVIPAWRVVTAGHDWKPEDWTHPGVYWSWDESEARAHWGNPEDDTTYLMHAMIPVEHVDWSTTLMMNASPGYEDEREIRVRDNSPIKVLKTQPIEFR